ncbi:MAG: ATP-binding protein [Chitinophagales bacterium]
MKSIYFLILFWVGLGIAPTIYAYSSTDSLQMLLDTLSDDKKRIEILLELGNQFTKENPNQALTHYASALILAENESNTTLMYSIHIDIGHIWKEEVNYAKAVNAYRKAAEIADKHKDSQLQSIAYVYIGDMYLQLQKIDVAIPYYLKAKRVFEAKRNQKSLGQTLKKIGESYQTKNRTDIAIQYSLSALETLVSFRSSRDFAETLENLGDLYFENSEYNKAANYYQRGIQLFEKLKINVDFEYLYQQLGQAQKLAGNETAATKSFLLAEEYALSKKKEEDDLVLKTLEDSVVNSMEVMTVMDSSYLEEESIVFEEGALELVDSDSLPFWETPKLDNKPTTTQTITNSSTKKNPAITPSLAIWKMAMIGIGILALGVLLGFLWCIRQYKKKWGELQKYMEDKDEKLIEQSREIKTLEKELQFFNHALYKGLQLPATDVKLHSNLLKEKYNGSLDKEGTQYVKQIQESATSLEGLLAAIFNFQQIKHYQLQLKEVNVTRIAQTITTELKGRYPKREIRFWVQEDMKIRADEELVRLLLANLLHNAVKFTQKNPIAIIEFGRKEHIFYVKDNGEGFHLQEAKVMFETFEPLKNTKNFEELTVSLLSMQTIVEKHAGIIWTISQKEKGATFFFTLDATPVKNEGKDFWNLSKSPHFKLML